MLSNRMRMGKKPEAFTKIITSSQVWNIPSGVDKVDITVIGGGCGGHGGYYTSTRSYGGDGGCSGYVNNILNVSLLGFQTLSIVIGAGGSRVERSGEVDSNVTFYGGDGGATAIKGNGSILLAEALGGTRQKGGSGGGEGAEIYSEDRFYHAGRGGSDGSGGYYNSQVKDEGGERSNGQGVTTRGINNTLYAGGGGGGAARVTWGGGGTTWPGPAAGGSGGGGAGALQIAYAGTPGTANTGGGGGGSAHNFVSTGASGRGGSGVVIIRWNG